MVGKITLLEEDRVKTKIYTLIYIQLKRRRGKHVKDRVRKSGGRGSE